jgi:hypothetical protein
LPQGCGVGKKVLIYDRANGHRHGRKRQGSVRASRNAMTTVDTEFFRVKGGHGIILFLGLQDDLPGTDANADAVSLAFFFVDVKQCHDLYPFLKAMS